MKKCFSVLLFVVFLLLVSVCSAELLEVHYINVGQADATLIVYGDYTMLIDGGNPGNSQLIYAYLKQLKISHLNYIVNTHSDADHIGGLPAAVIAVDGDVYTVLSPYTECNKERFTVYKNKLDEYGISISIPQKGEIYKLGDSEFQILSAGSGNCVNDRSIVIRLKYGNTSFVFTGDAVIDEEFSILAEGYFVNSDVLKLGHHGSKSSTSREFLEAVNPLYSVISCGKYNQYGHPSNDVMERLYSSGTEILRTDEEGHIVIVSDGNDLYVFTQKSEQVIDTIEAVFPDQPVGATSRILGAMAPTEYEEHYVLNMRSMKFHLPHCDAITEMSEHNRLDIYSTRDEMISQGYKPCGMCRP